ncbi:MAG: hypothetical protein ABI472_16055 [Ginsengibacter sp.]
MSTVLTGKNIADKLQEYPLPAKPGITDYIFYFVPASNGYGKGARYFFDKFYKKHKRKDVNSLQALIAFLFTEVKQGGVTQIREIVIVSHGNAQGLILQAVDDVSDPQLSDLKYITPISLSLLQKDFLAGKRMGFNDNRKEVIAHLKNDSWITIRACNFGYSKEGMYALYSFFGGRANMYAPAAYQFFGTHPIMKGMRYETKLKVHEHLVKQRFLPSDIHTPGRKDSIVEFLSDPGKFSDPFIVATKLLDDDTSAGSIQYEKIIDDLNNRRINDFLKIQVKTAGGQDLSPKALVRVTDKDSTWSIDDVLVHDNSNYNIEYTVYEVIGVSTSNKRQASLTVSATLPDMYSAREYFPIQLLFDEGDHKQWSGFVLVLASYTEDPGASPGEKINFDTILALLNAANPQTALSVITPLFASNSTPLTASAKITLQTTVPGKNIRKTWLVKDSINYIIKLEHPATSQGIQAHSLTAYTHPDGIAVLKEEYELMAYLGVDADIPGTELLAYLDGFTTDELVQFIDYLRSPYKPENVVYLNHANQAIKRKKDFLKWYMARPEIIDAINSGAPLYFDPYTDLSFSENDDNRAEVYDFDTNIYWKEVKASNPTATNFQTDLFTEEILQLTQDLLAMDNPESDSPYTDVDEIRALESAGVEHFFSTDKFVADTPTVNADCTEFADALAKIKALNTTDIQTIKDTLKTFPMQGPGTLGEYLSDPMTDLSIVVDLVGNFEVYAGSSNLVASTLARVAGSVAVEFLGYFFAVYGPIAMMIAFVQEEEKADANWEQKAKAVGIRQWARKLITLTYTSKTSFPTTLQLDRSWHDASGNPYYISRYYDEQVETWGVYFSFVWAPERMNKGFDEGWDLIEKAGNEMLSKVDSIFDQVLTESGLDPCKIQALRDSGLVDETKITDVIMREFAMKVLEKIPKP